MTKIGNHDLSFEFPTQHF